MPAQISLSMKWICGFCARIIGISTVPQFGMTWQYEEMARSTLQTKLPAMMLRGHLFAHVDLYLTEIKQSPTDK